MSENYDPNLETAGYRIPPNDTEAEMALLGCMFFGGDVIGEIYEKIKPEDFYRPDNRIIYEAMIDLFVRNIPVDLVTLKAGLDEKGLTEQAGGREYLLVLAGAVSTGANSEHYLRIVLKKSIQRKLIGAGQKIAQDGYDPGKEIDAVLEDAEKSIFNIVQGKDSGDFSLMKDLLVEAVNDIERIYKNKGQTAGISTGFTDLDLKTTGFHPSDLVLIAARPAMGKSALAHSVCQNVAVGQKIPTAIFSLEMSKIQIVNRLLCAVAKVDSQNLRTGNLDSSDWSKIVAALGPLSEAPLYIDDTPGITVGELRAKCRRLKMEKGLELIIIDYLQLMSGSRRNENRQQEVSEISRNLKAIAREMDAPVIALSQLSRAVESRGDKRPMLSDLRESGAIEQDADMVMFIYRDEYYNPESEKRGQAEIIIAKHRNGPTGTVDLRFIDKYTRFESLER
ncbi:MAG: replicative DNA helicase [Defluviitaleaceae bacterium]|nr:replicative DNA helicase [Defluviitaleaceae bacterium]